MESKISELLSRYETKAVFDQLCLWFESYFSRPVTSVADMKMRDSARERGRLWEEFCVAWLRSDERYEAVWPLCEVPQEVRQALRLGTQDDGIDLVARLRTSGPVCSPYVAIQCKYRSGGKKVTWRELSTFVGLCARTGPWCRHLVMTNGPGVSRKTQATPQDKTLAHGTFASTSRDRWLKIAGSYTEHRTSSSYHPVPSSRSLSETQKNHVREARLKRFEAATSE